MVKPVEPCQVCGADCDWCIGANRARAAFPRARVPPHHDADTEHHCHRCFLKLPGLQSFTCNPDDAGEGG